MLIGGVVFLQSCAPGRLTKMSAVVSSDQKIGFEETIFSQKKHSVSLAPYEELEFGKDKTMFVLGVQSGGDAKFDIGYESVSVFFQESGMTQPASRIKIQTREEFLSDLWEEQRRNENRYIRDALEDVVGELAINPPSSQELLDEFDDLETDIEIMRANNEMLRDALPEIVLQPRSVMPDGAYSGIVVCDTRKLDETAEGRFQVAVLVDGEKHIFSFNRVLNK